MSYDFLIETYETERLKTLSVWSLFKDQDLPVRPHPTDRRGRSVREQMIHQCVSENLWFKGMLGIEVTAQPLPESEDRASFLHRFAEDSGKRLEALRARSGDRAWWEDEVAFFDVARPRAWVMVRRIAHTAHHRGQLTTMLRQLGRDLYSTFGPTADTGGLMASHAPTIYAYRDLDELLADAAESAARAALPGPGAAPVTERPGS
jgi:uncharacterized damage-inducible protein DinB